MELKSDKILKYKLIQNRKLPEYHSGILPSILSAINESLFLMPNENASFAYNKEDVTQIPDTNKIVTPGLSNKEKIKFGYIDIPKPGSVSFADKTLFTTVPKEGLTYILKHGLLDTSKSADTSKVMDGAMNALEGVSTFMGIAEPRDASELSQYAKDLEGSVAGISYKKKSPISYKDGKLPGYVRGRSVFGDMFKGVSAGALFGSPIAAIAGGVLGGAYSILAGLDEEDTIKAINRRNAAYNYGNYNGALSTAILQANAAQYGDTRNGYLRPYKCGKLPGYSNGVRSAFGLINGMPANARTDGDELIIDTLTGAVAQNPSSKHTDSYNSYIRPQDMIIPGKQSKGLLKALGFKNGRLPGFANGRWDNFATSLASGVAGLSQYLQAMNDTPYKPNTYASNPYEKKALNDLYGLRANVYPILPSIYDAQAKGMYAIANSGGLSGGQRTLARLAATSGTQQNIGNMLLNAQNLNNQYLAQAANASLTAGNNAAQRRMQANQFDLDYFSKAHAARQQGMQMGLYNMVNSLLNYYKNKNKWDMFAMSHKLYSDELEAKKKGLIS